MFRPATLRSSAEALRSIRLLTPALSSLEEEREALLASPLPTANLRRMELRHLRYFIGVAEAENVSRAALKLHVSQPALSRQIRDLEEELGFSLLTRSAKSVRLTEAGRVFLAE